MLTTNKPNMTPLALSTTRGEQEPEANSTFVDEIWVAEYGVVKTDS
jgi:hypothetical protein